jgi:hypothetical protein
MNKIFALIIISCFAFSLTGYSQLSDRVNSPTTFKVGTRPLKGNLGLYFGLDYNQIESWFKNDSTDYSGLPLVNLKYYVSDKLVAKIGFQITNESKTATGLVDPLVDGSLLTERNEVDMTSKYIFTPGIEYHFKSSNILDVYVGGLLPFGMSAQEYVNDSKYKTGEYSLYKRTLKCFTYGYEAFVGLQAFVADLPFAIGMEFGAAGLGHLKNKYKHESNIMMGGISTSQIYYTTDKDAAYVRYRDLTSQDFKLQGNIRINLTYFFNK